uniref:uncharacterized protein LOC120344951 n=1 Tax=Styela clava TaxID=7725 RepID=UPI0019396C73|nr:uncharacterized protein LOC120344951 [Styela clava]
MNTVKVLGLVLAFALCYECIPIQLEEIGEDIEDHPIECQNIAGKDNMDTYHKRQDCEIVFRNEYVKWSEKMLADESFVKDLEVLNITEDNSNQSEGGISRPKRSAGSNECPVFNEEYLKNNKAWKQRSISPWTFFITYKANRVPQRMVDTRCLCDGCIDIRTLTEDVDNLISVRLPLTVPVTKNSKLTTEEVHLGCTCAVAITEDA